MSVVLEALLPVWRVLGVGLLLGAGLPAVFALGARALQGATGPTGEVAAPRPVARAAAVVCFAVVLVGVVSGILLVAASDWFLGVLGVG